MSGSLAGAECQVVDGGALGGTPVTASRQEPAADDRVDRVPPLMARGDDAVRLRLDVGYDGTDFSGWAAQPGRRTVQAVLEGALATLLSVPAPRLTVAGRTDAGVHARGQVCHVDVESSALVAMDVARLTSRLARLLPDDVRVSQVMVAPECFDARFSAIWRRYAYQLCDGPTGPDPLERRHTLGRTRRVDETAMNAAAALLVGEHDFAAFCKRREGATTVRSLHALEWTRFGDTVTARVVADAFCHNMVRALVGCLLVVGEGRRPVSWPAAVLRERRRDPRVGVVPARGLTLEEVGYPADSDLSTRAARTRTLRVPRLA